MLLRVSVDNPADKITEFGAGAKLYWARDNTSAAGAFTSASGNTPLVAGQTQYEVVDGSGAVGHYYRTRIGNTGATLFDTYAPVFQAGAPQTYATIDALRELLQLPDDSRDNLLSDILRRVTVKINTSLGFDFFRHPAVSGSEVRTYDGTGGGTISDVQGFASVSQVRWASTTGGIWTAAVATDYLLRLPVQADGPYLNLTVSGQGLRYWYYGYGTVEVTCVRGYASIPEDIEQAALYWAADLYRVGAYGGSQFGTSATIGGGVGLEESGQSRFAGGMPRITWETVEDYKRRHQICLVA